MPSKRWKFKNHGKLGLEKQNDKLKKITGDGQYQTLKDRRTRNFKEKAYEITEYEEKREGRTER